MTTTYRQPGRWALLLTAAMLAGCAGPHKTAPPPPPPPQLEMDPASVAQARQWYAQWAAEPAAAGKSDVRYAFLIGESASSGRAAYSRLTCRLVLQDADYRPIRRDGPIRILLIGAPGEADEQVVGGWQLDAAEAGAHYRYGIMPGYMLDLIWPRETGTGTYRLVVRWSDPQGRADVTSTFHFEDVFGYDVQTTPTTP